jgi:hypothetical protein
MMIRTFANDAARKTQGTYSEGWSLAWHATVGELTFGAAAVSRNDRPVAARISSRVANPATCALEDEFQERGE